VILVVGIREEIMTDQLLDIFTHTTVSPINHPLPCIIVNFNSSEHFAASQKCLLKPYKKLWKTARITKPVAGDSCSQWSVTCFVRYITEWRCTIWKDCMKYIESCRNSEEVVSCEPHCLRVLSLSSPFWKDLSKNRNVFRIPYFLRTKFGSKKRSSYYHQMLF